MNITPRSINPLEMAASRMLEGVAQLTLTLGLRANDFATLAPVVHDLFGRAEDDSGPAITGKQALYLEAKVQHAQARQSLRTAVADGRAFVMQAVNTLKGLIGNRWNANWQAVGFTSGSLQLPRHPLSKLTTLGAYYAAHGGHAVASLNLTAARAEELRATLVSAQSAVDGAKDLEKAAKRARDAAIKILRMRIKGLREELRCLLDPADSRWYRFGFRRPVDGSTPDLVEQVNLTIAGDDMVIAKWPPARLAENYRVSWKEAESNADPIEVGIVNDPKAIIRSVPIGVRLTVIVTARNKAGESVPTSADIEVPPISEAAAIALSLPPSAAAPGQLLE